MQPRAPKGSKWRVCNNSYKLLAVNYCCKALHLKFCVGVLATPLIWYDIMVLFKRSENNSSRTDPGRREKYNLNFYFHTSLRCLKRFYDSYCKEV